MDEFDWFLSPDFHAVRNLPPYSSTSYYSEEEYPVRIVLPQIGGNTDEYEEEGLGGSFSYSVTSPSLPNATIVIFQVMNQNRSMNRIAY